MKKYVKAAQNVSWSYFNKFEPAEDKFLPTRGEGTTKAQQVCTAVVKLVYKWYNDGDVYDNTRYLDGWANDLSSYANWLYTNVPVLKSLLEEVWYCHTDADYENLLKNLADYALDMEFLESLENEPKVGSVYDAEGPFKFVDDLDEEEDEYYEDEEDEEDW